MLANLIDGQILLITAHPDDETVFFLPTILNNPSRISLLCISNGNALGYGAQRVEELERVSQHLRFSSLKLVNDSLLQDGLTNDWNPNLIGRYVESEIEEVRPKIVITFDSKGISYHPNHCRVSDGVRRVIEKYPEVRFYSLKSAPWYRTYLGFFDFFFTYFERGIHFYNPLPIISNYKAMAYHQSQLTFKMLLQILLYRTSYINCLQPMKA